MTTAQELVLVAVSFICGMAVSWYANLAWQVFKTNRQAKIAKSDAWWAEHDRKLRVQFEKIGEDIIKAKYKD